MVQNPKWADLHTCRNSATTQTRSAHGCRPSRYQRRSSGCTTQCRMCRGERAVSGLSTKLSSIDCRPGGLPQAAVQGAWAALWDAGQQPKYLGLGMRSLAQLAGTFRLFMLQGLRTCLCALAWVLL